jgi:MFS family permease
MEQKRNVIKDKLWTKHFIMLMAMSFFMGVIMNMQMPVIPMYTISIGGSNSTIGTITGIFTIASLLFRPWFGNLLDTKGRRVILLAGIVLITLTSLTYGFTQAVVVLFVIRFLHGIGFSAQTTAAGTITSDIVPPARLGEGISYSGIAMTAAGAIGPILGLYIAQNYSYNSFFIVCFVLGVIAFICSLPISYEDKDKSSLTALFRRNKGENGIEKSDSNDSLKAGFIERTALKPSLVLFVMMIAGSSIFTFIPTYALSKDIKDIGIFFTVNSIAYLVVRPITGRISDKYGASKVIIPGMLFIILALIILAYANSLSTFLIVGILYGFGFSASQPTLNVVMLRLCPEDRRGAANATFFSAMDVGIGIGAVIWGFVSQKLGFTYVFLGSAACVVISLTLYVILLHSKLKKGRVAAIYEAMREAQ